MQKNFKLQLLGQHSLQSDNGMEIRFPTKKSAALFYYLADAAGDLLPRESLGTLLWPRSATEQSRASLRQELAVIRKTLRAYDFEPLVSDAQIVGVELADLKVDSLDLRALDPDDPAIIPSLGALYKGPFLNGFPSLGSDFDNWVWTRRTALQHGALSTVLRVLECLDADALAQTIAAAELALRIDPAEEQGHIRLIEALRDQGQRGQALRQVQICRKEMLDHLDTRPSERIDELEADVLSMTGHTSHKTARPAAKSSDDAANQPLDKNTDKPTIAVLPFTNMSSDPEQEYFSDGVTEDIITELARFNNLLVIARNSSFIFKGQSVSLSDVGARLHADFLVEGSIRKIANRVRITAQLIDAKTETHIWAERYERELEDIFVVQDEVTREIAAAVPGKLDETAVQIARRGVGNATAYDLVLRGEWYLSYDLMAPEAAEMFAKAIEIDPRCARAYSRLATYHAYSVLSGEGVSDQAIRLAAEYADKALKFDSMDPVVHGAAAEAYMLIGRHDVARRHIDIAIELNPNDYNIMLYAGIVYPYLGRHEDAAQYLERLTKLDPFPGTAVKEAYFDAYYMARRYEDAIKLFDDWSNPPLHMQVALAAAYAQLDRLTEADETLTRVGKADEVSFEARDVVSTHTKMCAVEADREHWLDGYRKAGLQI